MAECVKRFVVFGYDDYYPSGGWGDFEAAFDNREDADAWVAKMMNLEYRWPSGARYENYTVIDLADPANFASRHFN